MNGQERIQPYSLLGDFTSSRCRRRAFNDITHYINRILKFKLCFLDNPPIYFEWSFEKWMNRVLKKFIPKYRNKIYRILNFMFGTNEFNKCDAIVTDKKSLRNIYKMCYSYDNNVPRNLKPVKYERMTLT